MFERGNPYKNVDKDGHNPALVAALAYIGLRSVYGGFTAGLSDFIAQIDSGSDVDFGRVGIQALKGLGKGAVIGTVEVGIVAAGFFSSGALISVANPGTALFVGEELIDQLWDINYKEKLRDDSIEQQMLKDQNKINQKSQANPAQTPQTYQIPGSQGGQISVPRFPTYGVSASGAHYGSQNKDVRRSTGQKAAAARRAAESARSNKKSGKR